MAQQSNDVLQEGNKPEQKTPRFVWVALPIILVAIVWLSFEARDVLISINENMRQAHMLMEARKQERAAEPVAPPARKESE